MKKQVCFILIILFSFTCSAFGSIIGDIKTKAQKGNVEAQYILAAQIAFEGAKDRREATKAFKWFERAAEQGHVKSQLQVGTMLNSGTGTNYDPKQAITWFKKASAKGNPEALHQLAQMHYYGRGTPKNLEMAFKLFKKAAAKGKADAQYKVAQMFKEGAGTKRNNLKAYLWATIADHSGNVWARNMLGELDKLLKSKKGKKKIKKAKAAAKKWIKKHPKK